MGYISVNKAVAMAQRVLLMSADESESRFGENEYSIDARASAKMIAELNAEHQVAKIKSLEKRLSEADCGGCVLDETKKIQENLNRALEMNAESQATINSLEEKLLLAKVNAVEMATLVESQCKLNAAINRTELENIPAYKRATTIIKRHIVKVLGKETEG